MSKRNWKSKAVFIGNNLYVMRGMNSDSIDLIYLDPPFNSNKAYSAPIGSEAAGAAFKDTWTLSDVDLLEAGRLRKDKKGKCAVQVIELAEVSHSKGMRSYLTMMASRLIEMQRILKPSGSIYLHCDQTARHYLKILMDCIFGRKNYLNELVWHYFKPHSSKKKWPRNYDSILLYGNGKPATFNQDATLFEYDEKSVSRYDKVDADGRRYKLYKTKDGKIRKAYMKAGRSDNVLQIPFVQGTAKERIGYPTQKPLALLRRIVGASSNPGDVVFDPFCGCATTLVAADDLQRDWVGCDLSEKAAELLKLRLTMDKVGDKRAQNKLLAEIYMTETKPRRTDLGPELTAKEKKVYKHYLYVEVQDRRCNLCEKKFDVENLEMDHITPRKDGGTDHDFNFQLLCGHCNRVKGSRSQEEALAVIETMKMKR